MTTQTETKSWAVICAEQDAMLNEAITNQERAEAAVVRALAAYRAACELVGEARKVVRRGLEERERWGDVSRG